MRRRRLIRVLRVAVVAGVLALAAVGAIAVTTVLALPIMYGLGENIHPGENIDTIRRLLWLIPQTDVLAEDIPFVDPERIKDPAVRARLMSYPAVRFALRDNVFHVIYDPETRQVINSQVNYIMAGTRPSDG